MSAIVANLKEYLNTCLRYKNYNEYKPEDQISSVVAEWLKNRKGYSDYYVYLAWLAMRELMLKKFNNTIRVSDVTKIFMEYPDMFTKMIDNEIDDISEIFTDKMWLCNLCEDHYVHIYKVLSVAKKMYKIYFNMYGELEFVSLLPDEISGNLDNSELHNLKIMPLNDVVSKIITFLQTSLKDKKWHTEAYDTQYAINLYDLVLFTCTEFKYSDVNVQRIWYSVKFIIENSVEILANKNLQIIIDSFNQKHPELFKAIEAYRYFCYGEIDTALLTYAKTYIGPINRDDITINLPDIIVKTFKLSDKLNLCKEFYEAYQRLPKRNEVYKDFKIGKFIQSIKESCNSQLKQQVEEIFEQEINAKKIVKLSDEDKLNLCKEFYTEFKRLPKICEVYKDFNIGKFIQNLKYGRHPQLKQQVKEIFHQEINAVKKVVTTANTVNKQIDYEQKEREYDVIEDALELIKKLMDFIYDLRASEHGKYSDELSEIETAMKILKILLE